MSGLSASWLRQRLARSLAQGVMEEWQRVSTAFRAQFSTLNPSQHHKLSTAPAQCRAQATASPANAPTSPAVLAASGHTFSTRESHGHGFAAGAILTAGAFALGTILGGPVAECKSPIDPSDPSGGPGKPVGGEQAEKVMSVWEGVEQEILRADAQLPAGRASTPLQAPQIKKAQGSTVVDVVVRQGVSLPHLERAILTLQPGLSASSRHQSAKMQEDMTKKLVTVSQGNRSISLSLPKVSQGEARVSFWKQGDIDEGDLPVLGHIMSLANDMQLDQLPLQASPFMSCGSMEPQSIDELLMGPFGAPRDILELFGRIRDEIEQDSKFMELGEEWKDESFSMQQGQEGFDPPNSPFMQLPPSQAHEQKPNQVAGPDSKMSWEQASQQLRNLGALVYLPDDEEQKELDWSDMAGYDVQKRTVEDLVLMSVKHADEYERVAKQTRKDGKHQRPKAVLLEGPPGTGKTHVVRIVSSQASIPLVYIPLESTASKWYGESEKKLSQMLNLAERMGGCIIFLDEVDSLATKRADDMNEATRRLLGVLLRFIDGFKATDSIVIGATNRQEDLDTALLSRCQSIVTFGLPDEQCRAEILKHYAAHLKQKELDAIAASTRGMAARDLKAICEEAERGWVSSIIRGQAAKGSLPPLSAYTAAAKARSSSLRMYV